MMISRHLYPILFTITNRRANQLTNNLFCYLQHSIATIDLDISTVANREVSMFVAVATIKR